MTTENKIYWGVGIFSVVIILGAFLIPGDRPNKEDLPWHIEHPAPNAVKVFGLTLGQSTPGDAEARFKEEGEPSLFKSPAGALSAELFFEQINLAGLRSRVVLTAAIPETELKAMYERGLRLAGTGSGKKITLTPDDIATLRKAPISSLTYMPGVKVDEALFLKRFGEPSQIIKEEKLGTTHWLYPQHGLDITMGGNEKPVLQYVPPTEFDKLVKPLLNQTAQTSK
ncbi:MAG: hypothetical protein A3J87_00910 [Sideroxydans sp. RIFOXYB12_FULL_59_6]|nr:MAG: hypothetical protein A3J87_00910 [Sideroxydans sp. RIFOXYB12_FULL_59_6]